VTYKQYEVLKQKNELNDEFIGPRYDMMVNDMDYNNDRKVVRDRFFNEAHKKTSIKDIGSLLDKMLYAEKVKSAINTNTQGMEIPDLEENQEAPTHMSRDITFKDLKWSERVTGLENPITPNLMDDASPLDRELEGDDYFQREALAQIKHEDATSDHSLQALTNQERQEIELFHSIKSDPYFRHYI
jgi:hypothetical protein